MSGALAYTPIQVPDYNQTLARLQGMQANRLQMLAAQRQLQQGQQMDEFMAGNAAGFASPNADKRMNLLAQLGAVPGGAQVALPMIQQLREQQQMDNALPLLFGGSGAPSPQAAPGAPGPGGVPSSPAGAGAGDPSLPRGLRNNNPLNLSFVQGQPGVQGTDGRFGIYATPEAGIAAGVRQLQLYAQRGITRLGDIINRWAPPSENNTGGYVATVARMTGLGPNDPVDLSNPEVVTRLVTAMAQVENGRPLDPAIAARGVQLALGGGADPNATPVEMRQGGAPAAPGATGVTPQQAQALVAPQGVTAENLQRFIAATRGNPAALRIVQAVAPLIRQGAQTEIKELGEANGQPAGLYVVNSQTGQRVAYVGPSATRNLQTVDLGEGAPEGPGRYAVENGQIGRRLGAQPPPATQTVIDQRGQSAFDQRRGTTLAEEETDVRQGLARSQQTLARLATIENNLERFTTGLGSNVRIQAGQLAAQLGVPPSALERLGIDPSSVAAGENIRSLASQMLLGLIGPGGFPAQNFSNADREMLERALPSLMNSPNGNRLIIQIMRAQAERTREIGLAWNEWRRANGTSLESFDRFQLERVPQIAGRDVLAPLLQDAFPVGNNMQPGTAGPGGRGTAEPPPAPVRVRTPEEARALPSGTPIILPDGSMGRVP